MLGQHKVFKWLLILVIFCFCICGQSLAEEETFAYEEGMRLIAVPRNTTAADSVTAITEAYITCDHTMLTLGEEAVWTLHLEGGVPGAYTIDYALLRHAPTDPKNVYTLYSQEMGTTALSYTSLPADTGAYLLQVFIRDQYEGVLEVFSGAYTTDDDAALTQKIAEVFSLCKNSGATTDYEIALFMHDYLINHADYDQTYTHYSAHGVLLYGSGTCQSYASAYKILLENSGVECLWVDGTAGEEHCWNIVKIDGVWYQVDCTWDDPIGGPEREDYFLITDEEMAKDHQWNEAAYPECNDDRYMENENDENVIYTEGYYQYRVSKGKAIITKYTGREEHIIVPGRLGGYSVRSIDSYAFNVESPSGGHSSNVTAKTLTISENVEYLDRDAVFAMQTLETINLPASLKGIIGFDVYGEKRIWGFESGIPWTAASYAIKEFCVAEGNKYICSVDGIIYDKDKKNILYVPVDYDIEVLVLPEGVTQLPRLANNTHIKEIVLPDSITAIGMDQFMGISSLEKINIPETCTFIGDNAFNGTAIKDIYIPANAVVHPRAFLGSDIRNVTLHPDNERYYIKNDFLLLKENDDIVTILFFGDPLKFKLPEEVTFLGGYLGRNTVIERFVVSEKIWGIDWVPFEEWTHLCEIVIPATVTYMPPDQRLIFSNAPQKGIIVYGEKGSAAEKYMMEQQQTGVLEFVPIGETFEVSGTCGDQATWRLDATRTLTVSGRGEMYDYEPMESPWILYSRMIDTVVINDGITTIGENAFFGSWMLKSVKMASSVTTIRSGAFRSNDRLVHVELSENLHTIKGTAFDSCRQLREIQIPASLKEMDWTVWLWSPELTLVVNQCSYAHAMCLTYGINHKVKNVSDGGDDIPLKHTYNENVTSAPTCTTEGVKTFSCAICGYSYTEAIPAQGHTVNVAAGIAPTCTSSGLTEGTWCGKCGLIFADHVVIPALGHTEEVLPAVAPTCTTTGWTEGKQCSVCGTLLAAQTEVLPTGHTAGEKIVVTAPTVTTPGLARVSCTVCSETIQEEEIPALGITCVAGDANNDGSVNLFDALAILQYDVGWDVELNHANADVNEDGAIDLFDALLILQYDVGWDVELL